MNPLELDADRAAQIDLLDRAGHGPEARACFALFDELLAAHRLADRGRLGVADSRNHARGVRDEAGRELVLKITVAGGEGELAALQAWQRAGLAGTTTAKVVAHGVDPRGRWILQQRLPGTKVTRDQAWAWLPRLAATARALRLPDAQQRQVTSGLQCVHQHLAGRVAADRSQMTADLADVADRALQHVSRLPGVHLLHGDFALRNVLVQGVRVRTIDPVGLAGPYAFEPARLLAWSYTHRPIAPDLPHVAALFGVPLHDLAVLTAVELTLMSTWAARGGDLGRPAEQIAADAADVLALA